MFRPVSLTVLKAQTEIILGTYDVRVHTRISREPWARLWYLCRALDRDGSGHLVLPLPVIQSFLSCSDKSVYRWRQQAKKVGAFRHFNIKTGEIWLGSMFTVCQNMNLRYWGAVGVVSLGEVLTRLRSLTTGIVTQKFQQRSRYAANSQLKPEYRKFYGAPHPNELIEDKGQSSLKSAAGEVPCVLHISSSRVFVSKNFTHYGTSQHAISCELGIHTRTVRRHQRSLGMCRRQLCQAKIEYHQLKNALEHDAPECWAYTGDKTDIGYQVLGDAIAFSDGVPQGAKKKRVNSYRISKAEFDGRFFKVGGKVFMNRCNLYREDFTLAAMTAARRKYRTRIKWHSDTFQKNEPAGVADVLKECPHQPRYEGHF